MGFFSWLTGKSGNPGELAAMHFGRAIAAMNQGQQQVAVTELTKSLSHNAEVSEIYLYRALAYQNLGVHSKAIADFTAAIDLDPQYGELYGCRGDVYSDKGDFKNAISDYDCAIRLKPDYVTAYFRRGVCYGLRGNDQKAIKDLARVLELDPTHQGALFNRGVAYNESNKHQLAAADLQEAHRLDPDNPSIEAQLAVSLRAVTRAKLEPLKDLSVKTARRLDSESASGPEVAGEVVRSVRDPKSYVSNYTMMSGPCNGTDEKQSVIEWALDYLAPDRFHVCQMIGAPDESGARPYDEWIAIGSDQYRRLGAWYEVPNPEEQTTPETNRYLRVDKFLRVMESAEPDAISIWQYREQPFFLLEFNQIPERAADEFSFFEELFSHTHRVRFWIDATTHFLAKAEIEIACRDQDEPDQDILIEQTFAAYNEQLLILPPPSGIRMDEQT